ncbi:unnamed protein product [Urochloa decumbens]|uniref:FBD domain-containing protein n=1 Tax=Urochloa decumbens TaxID=240449 RepID=A0ABC8ZPL9_9POAL
MLQELIVVNAPCLERLHHRAPHKYNLHVSIISAPKLKILGRLTDNISRLELRLAQLFLSPNTIIMATAIHTVKVLARLDNLGSHAIINLMKLLSLLGETYIGTKNTELHNSHDHIECLDLHLKRIRIRCYSGKGSHLAFARFFVLNVFVLESMVLDVNPDNDKMISDRWIENQRKQLKLEKKASIGAQVDFTYF